LSPLDACWHLLNFFAPAFCVACLTAAASKLLWRSELRAVSWRRLALWGAGAGALGSVIAVVLLGRDGKMTGYGLMLLAVAAAQTVVSLRTGTKGVKSKPSRQP